VGVRDQKPLAIAGTFLSFAFVPSPGFNLKRTEQGVGKKKKQHFVLCAKNPPCQSLRRGARCTLLGRHAASPPSGTTWRRGIASAWPQRAGPSHGPQQLASARRLHCNGRGSNAVVLQVTTATFLAPPISVTNVPA
jgi:hypothetical protein